jgi:threonyl-tRNA synthetase
VQATVLPISDKHTDYARGIMDSLLKEGIRADIDNSNEKMGYKVRKATLLKTPYMCIIGDSEVTNNTVNIRKKDGTSIGEMPVDQFTALLRDEILNRR